MNARMADTPRRVRVRLNRLYIQNHGGDSDNRETGPIAAIVWSIMRNSGARPMHEPITYRRTPQHS